jgi:hypothetical protein
MAENVETLNQPITSEAVNPETRESIQRLEATMNNPVDRATTPTVRLTTGEAIRQTMTDVFNQMKAAAFKNVKVDIALFYTLLAPFGTTELPDVISVIAKANEHLTVDRYHRPITEAQSQSIARVAQMVDPYPDVSAVHVRDRLLGTLFPAVSWISPVEQFYKNNIEIVHTALEGTKNILNTFDNGPGAVLANVARRLNILQSPQVAAAAAVFA